MASISIDDTTLGVLCTEEIPDIFDDLFVRQTFTATYSIGANGPKALLANDFDYTPPNGYRPMAIAKIRTGHSQIEVQQFGITSLIMPGTETLMTLYNTSSTARSNVTAEVTIVFVKAYAISEL